jgi:hypothetical protein
MCNATLEIEKHHPQDDVRYDGAAARCSAVLVLVLVLVVLVLCSAVRCCSVLFAMRDAMRYDAIRWRCEEWLKGLET